MLITRLLEAAILHKQYYYYLGVEGESLTLVSDKTRVYQKLLDTCQMTRPQLTVFFTHFLKVVGPHKTQLDTIGHKSCPTTSFDIVSNISDNFVRQVSDLTLV